jgi:hypothetical protein
MTPALSRRLRRGKSDQGRLTEKEMVQHDKPPILKVTKMKKNVT